MLARNSVQILSTKLLRLITGCLAEGLGNELRLLHTLWDDGN